MPETLRHPLVYTVTEAAQLLRINRGSAYALVHSGTLRAVRVNRRILVPASALAEFLLTSPGGTQ